MIETNAARILIDPGVLSDAWHGLTGLDAVLVTHVHADHLDPASAAPLARANPGAAWYAEPAALGLLPEGANGSALRAGESVAIGGLPVAAIGGAHASIHPDLPGVGNVGLVIGGRGEPRLFHPGDSYDEAPDDIDLLALPLQAPWSSLAQTVDFARAVGAPRTLPIHDRLLSRAGRAVYLARLGELTDTELLEPPEGRAIEV